MHINYFFYRITSAVATFIINDLILGTNTEFRQLAEAYDWYIFPVTNPDGFVHSHENVSTYCLIK